MPRRAFVVCLLLAATAAPAVAQKDRVHFRDRATGKEETADGDVVDTSGGVKLTVAGKERVIPAPDILRIEYVALDPAPGKVPVVQAEAKPPADALKFYADAAKALPNSAAERAKRTVAFREAYWTGVVAAGKPDADFPAEAKRAADKMAAFVKAYPKSWEQWQVGRSAARLYGELKDWAAAEAVLKDLSGIADAPIELRLDVKLARVGYHIRAGKPTEAGGVLNEVAGDAALTGGLKDRAGMYAVALKALPAKGDAGPQAKKAAADAVADLEKAVAASKDPAARSVGYGLLGEVQLAYRQLRPATWSFCTVDVVYPQDADERLFAVLRLAEIFAATGDKEGDKSRADQFRERLPKVR
mgnify:CR=1 FL=1